MQKTFASIMRVKKKVNWFWPSVANDDLVKQKHNGMKIRNFY